MINDKRIKENESGEPSLKLIGEALGHAGEDQETLERLAHLEYRRITPDKVLPPMEFLFRMFGMPCFPRGELVALTGKAKSGKTFVCSVLMTLCFRPEVLMMLRESNIPLSVLWYDTEQSDESTQDILKNRVMPMIGESFPSEDFHIFNVRQDMWPERMPMLETAIRRFKPDLVILDGIRDLINDINDCKLAQDTVERLMHLASAEHCCIVSVLHENKSAEDHNLRGWIGTELTHKAFEVYECAKSDDLIFSLTQRMTRKHDILDTLKFIVDKQGIPQIASVELLLDSEKRQRLASGSSRPELNRAYIKEWSGTKPVFNVSLVFKDALPEGDTLYLAKDVQEAVMKITNITSSLYYNKLREEAIASGVITKTTNEYNHICYFRPMTEEEISMQNMLSLFPPSPGDAPY